MERSASPSRENLPESGRDVRENLISGTLILSLDGKNALNNVRTAVG